MNWQATASRQQWLAARRLANELRQPLPLLFITAVIAVVAAATILFVARINWWLLLCALTSCCAVAMSFSTLFAHFIYLLFSF